MKYTVVVADNFHYMDETEHYTEGEFDTADAAIECAKLVVDRCLADNFSYLSKQQPDGKTVSSVELYAQYTSFGDDPFIISEDKTVKFSAWTYAEERCREMISAPGGQ